MAIRVFAVKLINLNVVNADIREILNYITEQYGINFVIDKSVKAIPVTVNVSDVPWNVALDAILRSQDLGVQVNGPILRVAEQKICRRISHRAENQRKSTGHFAALYGIYSLKLCACIRNINRRFGRSGQFTAGVTSGGSSAGSVSGGGSDQGVLGIIKRRLSRRGAVEVDGRSNTLIITDVRENIDAIRQFVTLLDQPEPQVEIEARIVVATRNFSRDLGVQLAALVLGRNGRAGSFSNLPEVKRRAAIQAAEIRPALFREEFRTASEFNPTTV